MLGRVPCRPERRGLDPSRREALIRTLGVSLVAIAAIVASLAVVRQRQEEAQPPEGQKGPQISPAQVNLDQLRAAGF